MHSILRAFSVAFFCTASSMALPAVSARATTASSSSKPSGVDLAGIDHSIKPGDDFDGYASGAWRKTAAIPADRSSTGTGFQVFLKAEQRTSDLIRDAGKRGGTDANAQKISNYYAAYMDEAGIEKRGLAPLQPELARIDAIQSRTDLARVLGSQLRADVDPINNTNLHTDHLFGLFVTQGLEDPAHNLPYLLQGGLGMPNRDYYLTSDKAMDAFRSQYQIYIASLLKLAGSVDAQAQAKAIFELETKIAAAQASLVESEDVHKANNVWEAAAFAKNAPGLDWKTYFEAAGLSRQKHIDVWQADATRQLSALVASEPLDTWKTYLRFHALDDSAGLLPKAYADLNFEFYGHVLQGTPKQRERWKLAVAEINQNLGDAVGQLYVKQYFPPASKAEVQRMVKNIIAAFDARVGTLDWMTAATKQKAKAKIATIRVGVGYPETWRDYSTLDIRADDALGNQQRAVAYEYRHQLAKLGQAVDRDEWWMTPQTVNAVNLPLQNALNFPAAILEAPFFDPNADAAANYGSIGAVIGHEISHSFDNTGAEFDAQGRLSNWWTAEDQTHFKAAGQRLVDQYSAYEALPGLHLNGEQTLGENIADVSGLAIAHAAYRKSLDGKPAPVIDGMSGDQRFFIAFAQSWRTKMREAALRQRVVADGHSPGNFRAQTVRNIDTWYDAFAPAPGEKLYLAPDARVRIW